MSCREKYNLFGTSSARNEHRVIFLHKMCTFMFDFENLPCIVCSFGVAYKTSTSSPFLQTTFGITQHTKPFCFTQRHDLKRPCGGRHITIRCNIDNFFLQCVQSAFVMHAPHTQIHLPYTVNDSDSIKISLLSYIHFKAASTRVLKAKSYLGILIELRSG